MQANKIDFTVVEVQTEDQSVDKKQLGTYIYYNDQELDHIVADETDHRIVLELPSEDAIIRMTLMKLSDQTRIGSISFKASTLNDNSGDEIKEVWVTLFDHEDDDEYDGDLTEDDLEVPRIKVSLINGDLPEPSESSNVKTITTITKTVTQVPDTHEIMETREYSIESLKAELQSQLNELIESLRNTQVDLDAENNSRIDVLANLENVHAELKGEDAQDQEFTNILTKLKQETIDNLNSNREELESRKKNLLDTIQELEDLAKQVQADKEAAEAENARLKGMIDSIDDQKDHKMPEEALKLIKDNEELKGNSEKMTQDLLGFINQRNEIVNAHSNLVKEFEKMINTYHDDLRKAAQTEKSLASEKAALQKELEFADLESDFMKRRIEGGELDSKSLSDALERLTNEYKEADQEYIRYTDQLRSNLKNQKLTLDDLVKKLDDIEGEIADNEMHKSWLVNDTNCIQGQIKKIEDIEYEKNFTEASGKLNDFENQRRANQDALEKAYLNLQTKIDVFSDDLAGKQKQRDEQADKINKALKDLQDATSNINDLLKEIEDLQNKLFTDENRDQVQKNAAIELESLGNKLKTAKDLREKAKGDLQDAINGLDDKHRQLEEQKSKLDSLTDEVNKLQGVVDDRNKTICDLENDVRAADEELDRLNNDDELERLQAYLDDLDNKIHDTEVQIGNRPPPKQENIYKAIKGDLVDEMLAKYIQDCPVPVKRLGGGFYLFGTKKIYAKIMNGKLVIRVGGGYMVIEKFIETYADQELTKINAILEREGLTSVDEIDLEEYCLKGNKTKYGNTRGEASPTSQPNLNSSFRGNSSMKKSINGTTKTQKTVKVSQIVSSKTTL